MANRYTFQLAHTPEILKRIVDCVHAENFNEKIEADRFTLSEMVAHLADFEDIFLDRMRLAVEKPGASIVTFDPDERSVEKAYASRDLVHELVVFANRRRDTMTFLQELCADDRKKFFVHPELGAITVDQQVALMSGHDLYHINQATQHLRIG
ncbi:DinB family protein [bacterium]|nr:MAG: DinB family protein [bacterium]